MPPRLARGGRRPHVGGMSKMIPRTIAALVFMALAARVAAPLAAQGFDVVEATIAEARAAMESGELTCRALVQGYLDRIAAYDQVGPRLNTVQTLNARALEQADSLDQAMRTRGLTGPPRDSVCSCRAWPAASRSAGGGLWRNFTGQTT